MKQKLIICLSILFLSINGFSQNGSSYRYSSGKENANNEIKFNLLTAVIGYPELNYEYFFDDNMGVGLAGAVSLEKSEDMDLRYMLLPYYRMYFGHKKSSGFFIEGNMALVRQKGYVYNDDYYNSGYSYYGYSYSKLVTTTNFGFGAALGVKLLAKNGYVGELYLGIGRLFGEAVNSAYPRVGICLGKRF